MIMILGSIIDILSKGALSTPSPNLRFYSLDTY